MKKLWLLIAALCVLMTGTASATSVTGFGTATGFSDEIMVTLTLVDFVITEMNVDHNETPTIGGVAAEVLPAEIVEHNSLNVDVYAGATVTSKAILEAAKIALLSAGLDPNDYMDEVGSGPVTPEEPEEGKVEMPAGAFTGAAMGMMDYVTVGLMIENGTITAVYVDHNETPTIGSVAAEVLPAEIVEHNSLNVDVVTGATVTSKAILEAAKNALLSAGLDPNDYDYMDEGGSGTVTPEEPEEGKVAMPAGAFMGTAIGMMDYVTVGLMIENGTITAVYVDHNETPTIGSVAAEVLPAEIVEHNSLNVDVVTGATVTSKAILEAAKIALLSAGLDPNDYMDEVEPEAEPGDADGDGNIAINDVIVMLQYLAGDQVEVNMASADVDNDGKMSLMDVLRILQYQAGWDVKLQ